MFDHLEILLPPGGVAEDMERQVLHVSSGGARLPSTRFIPPVAGDNGARGDRA